ncbi:MAG: hypothetical protein GY801_19065, partial [bacterium]|nr:hypothetical protein [bacterium]
MNSRHVDVPNGNMLNTLSNERIVHRLVQLPEQAVVLQYPLKKGIQHPASAENLFPATSERLPGVRAETCGIDAAQRLALLCELPKPFDT